MIPSFIFLTTSILVAHVTPVKLFPDLEYFSLYSNVPQHTIVKIVYNLNHVKEMATKISKKDMPPKVHQLVMIDDEINLEKWLTEHPMDIETEYRKETPIHATIRYNAMKCLKVCLNFGADISSIGKSKVGILKKAIIQRNEIAVKIIIESSEQSDIIRDDIYDRSLLEVIISLDAVEMLKLLNNSSFNIFMLDAKDESSLHFATNWKAYKCKTFLYGLNPPMTTIMQPSDECTNVFLTTMERNDYDAFRMIASREDFKNYVNIPYTGQYEGKTHLHFATKLGLIKMVAILVEKGANINAQDIEGNTPLHKTTNVEIAKFLINNGADKNIKNYNDQNPEEFNNINVNQKTLAICQWYILTTSQDEEILYNKKNIKGYMSFMIQRQPPSLEICPFRVRQIRKQKKNLWQQRPAKQVTEIEGHVEETQLPSIKKGKEEDAF